jgi:hypothetical protein
VTATVVRVLLKNMFHANRVKPPDAAYFYFGDASNAYLVHELIWHPDFDQVLRVAPIPMPAKCKGQVLRLVIPGRPNGEESRIKPEETLAGPPAVPVQ